MGSLRAQDLRFPLGLSSSDCNDQWIKIQSDARAILHRNGLLGKYARTDEVKEKKLALTKELEIMNLSIPSLTARQSISYDLLSPEMQKFLGREQFKHRYTPPGQSRKRMGWIVVVASNTPLTTNMVPHCHSTDTSKAAFQRVANEGKFLTNWSVVVKIKKIPQSLPNGQHHHQRYR